MLQSLMIKLLLLTTILLFSACVNKRGISTHYNNKCREYYDVQGTYHKKCDENEVLEFKTVKELPQKTMELFEEDDNADKEMNVY